MNDNKELIVLKVQLEAMSDPYSGMSSLVIAGIAIRALAAFEQVTAERDMAEARLVAVQKIVDAPYEAGGIPGLWYDRLFDALTATGQEGNNDE